MKSLVFFNNKGGVGKTTLLFNVAHMMARSGFGTVLLDYDPQCNLSALSMGEDELFDIWTDDRDEGATVARCVDLVRRGKGDLIAPSFHEVADSLYILPGDLSLSRFEQPLAQGWAQIQSTDNEAALHVTTALVRLAELAASNIAADVVLIDVGPSLGALNRAALLAADAVVVPVAPDLFSLQGLRNIGPAMRDWREDWKRVQERSSVAIPGRGFVPRGYIVQQHLARVDRPVRGYENWASQIPAVFHEAVLATPAGRWPKSPADDPYCIAMLKHFASLVPIAQQSRKPIFDLKQADGIGGGQIQAVARARSEFQDVVKKLTVLLEL